MGDQRAAGVTLVGDDALDQIRVEALCLQAGAESLHDQLRAVHDLRRGIAAALAAGSAVIIKPAPQVGMATGKFHGGVTTVTR